MNSSLKEEIVGKNLKVVIAEPYDKDQRFFVAYPLLHGPVVLVERVDELLDQLVEVEITRVISERIVEGKVVHVMPSFKYSI